MENNLDALIKALADLVWEHIEYRVSEKVMECIRDTEFDVEIEAEITPRV